MIHTQLNMALQSTYNPQGGTGISLGNYNPQGGGGISLQNTPQTGVPLQGSAPAPPPPAYSAPSAPATVYAPKLDLSSIYNQAQNSAAGAVNPYYTKSLADFVTQQTEAQDQFQKQQALNQQALDQQYQNTLAANQLTGQRTSQDVLGNEQQAGIKADQTQQDQGTAFDQARIAQAKQLATAGLTTSGLGGQQVAQSEAAHNTQEGRQAADLAQQNQQQELFKSRTFEDLAKSSELAGQAKTGKEQQAAFDLHNYIINRGQDLQKQTASLEQQRLQALGSQTQSQAKILVNNFIQSLSDPAQRLAAAQQYGGAF